MRMARRPPRSGRAAGPLVLVAGCALVVLGWAAAAFAAVPPLTDAQRQQLQTTQDYTPSWDEGALYPLLENVWQWERQDEAGAMIPDWESIKASPAEHRGRLFVIEGQLAGPPEKVPFKLARPGPWDDKLQRWGILYRINPDEVAVIYLLDPPAPGSTPRAASHVRILSRFYKMWRFKDRQGKPTDYPVFIARTVTTTRHARDSGLTGAMTGNQVQRLLLVFTCILGVAFVVLFRKGRKLSLEPRPLPGQLRRKAEQQTRTQTPDDIDTIRAATPEDALRNMAGEETKDGDQHGDR